jgi:hypothetical protein
MATVLMLTISVAAPAQTRIERHKNSYTPEQDVQLGREAAAQVRRQMPLLDDDRTEDFVERVGERLIAEIPDDFRQPQFRYTFEVVNMREINAFALPGGPMFLNRGMIQAARTEGEVAGVMAHELSHVILRHGTVQATRGQKFQLGALAGQIVGAIMGGRKGAAVADVTQLGLGAYFLKYSREFEREADLLGAQLMARAGYDPREMASMFETIERQGGSRGPEWLSSHPNPGNRAQAINREAAMLQSARRSTTSDELRSVHARLNQLPAAPTAEQVARAQGQGGSRRTGTTERAMRVDPPSERWRTYQPDDFLRLSVPANWEPIDAGGTITYAPDGGYFRGDRGQSVFTHGIEVGVARTQNGSLQQQTEQLLQSFARSNPQLRRQSGYSRTTIDGRPGLTTTLANVSEATGDSEAVNVSTVQLEDGRLLYLIGVAPANEARTYLNTFGRVRQTVRLD